MTKVDLLGFLTTGSLGPLRLSLGKETAVHLLGDPDGTLLSSKTVETIRYGNLQLQFTKGQLVLISLDFAPQPPGSKQVFEYSPWSPTSPLSKDDFERDVSHLQIEFTIDTATTYGSSLTLGASGSGTHVTFNEGQLESIYVSMKTS